MATDGGDEKRFVSRGGIKLEAALDEFGLVVKDFVCADFGCNVGGFTDCLLQRGAKKVYAIDTGYGPLAWKLRCDDRVVVLERANAMHVEAMEAGIDLVVIDMGWTKQAYSIPAALRWEPRHVITLIKPHYEATGEVKRGGILEENEAEKVAMRVLGEMESLGVEVVNSIRSPIRGGKSKNKAGNYEYLALVKMIL